MGISLSNGRWYCDVPYQYLNNTKLFSILLSRKLINNNKILAKVAQELQISEGKVFAQVPHPVIIASANNGKILNEYLNQILTNPEIIQEKAEINAMGVTNILEAE